MEASWNAWTRPWSTWGFLPIHLLPCCPKPNPPPRPITPTTPVPITTAPTTVATTERVQFVTVEFITDSTTDPTDSPPTTISPPTPEVQPTQLPTTEKVQPTLPTTEKVQPTSLPTTEKVQASTLPVTEDVQLDDSTDDPSDAIPNTVIKYESPLVEISSNEYLPVQNEPNSAQHASSANLGTKHLDGALIFPLISPQLLDNMTPELTTTTPAKTMTSDAATNVQSNSAINDAMTDPMAEKVPMLISPLPVNSAIDGDSAIVKKPSGFSDSTEEDLMDGGLIPNVPLTKSPKDETNIDMTQLIELGDMLTQLKRSGEIKDGDSLPPESIPLKGLKLFMNLYPPSYISFLRR